MTVDNLINSIDYFWIFSYNQQELNYYMYTHHGRFKDYNFITTNSPTIFIMAGLLRNELKSTPPMFIPGNPGNPEAAPAYNNKMG